MKLKINDSDDRFILLEELEDYVFFDEYTSKSILEKNQRIIKKLFLKKELFNYNHELNSVEKGYIFFKNLISGQDVDSYGFYRIKTLLTGICSCFAQPILVIARLGVWIKIDVDLRRRSDRAGGTGKLPLHTDLVNTINPPNYTALFCEREDPLQGGVSILSNYQNAINHIVVKHEIDLDFLHEARYSEGKYFGMKGVGGECNPFPLVEKLNNNEYRYRYTARLLDLYGYPEKRSILSDIQEYLESNIMKIPLKKGDLLIFNQNILVHGRTELGEPQRGISRDRRRLIYQLFLRSYSE